jgi:hypothetical protein
MLIYEWTKFIDIPLFVIVNGYIDRNVLNQTIQSQNIK